MVKRNNWIDWILQNRVISHLIFWVLVFISLPILAALNEGSVKKTVMSSFAYLPGQLIASYFLVYYQVPKLLFKRKYLQFGLSLLISIYLLLVFTKFLSVNFTKIFAPEYYKEKSLVDILSDPFNLAVVYFPSVYVFVFLLFMMKAFKDRLEERHQLEVLQKEKVNTELKFLKAQINPHFLFNTLNNLYSLTLEESAEKSSEVVLKLSDMLDYMLYQCKDPEVPLKNEITFIQDYIGLESLRYGDKLTLDFRYQLHNPHVMIAPLILISFIENAFKHGASNTLEDSKITIELTTNQDQLYFTITNSLPSDEEIGVPNESNSGIGISNSKRQLELHYINNYTLESIKTDKSFQVVLTINL